MLCNLNKQDNNYYYIFIIIINNITLDYLNKIYVYIVYMLCIYE